MPAKKKKSRKRPASKKSVAKKRTAAKTRSAARRPARKKQGSSGRASQRTGLQAPFEEQSGDLQGLSAREGADSESVKELLEEGNAFEADVVKGVEDAGDAEEREVHTHEVPEDDVPPEYLDKD